MNTQSSFEENAFSSTPGNSTHSVYRYPTCGWMCSKRSSLLDTMAFRSILTGPCWRVSEVCSEQKVSLPWSHFSTQRPKQEFTYSLDLVLTSMLRSPAADFQAG